MSRLLKYEMMFYRETGLVLVGFLFLVTLLGWLIHLVFAISAGIILIVCWVFYILVLCIAPPIIDFPLYHKKPELPVTSLILLVPVPVFWSLLARLLASLPIFAVTAACHTLLSIAFRHHPGINPYDGWQWLILMGLYIFGQLSFVTGFSASSALKDRLALPKSLRFLRKLFWWPKDELSFFSPMNFLFLIIYVAIAQYLLQIIFYSEYLPLSHLTLAFMVYPFSIILLYTASYLLEKYSN